MVFYNFLGQRAAAIKREEHVNFINRIIFYKIEIANIDDSGKLPVYKESKELKS